MSDDAAAWVGDWRLKVRVWVERDGRAVLGEGRLELLEWIDRCHSISCAARQLGVSYRHAWVTVREINEAAGAPLVAAAVGGRQGGGAQLTPFGRLAVARLRPLRDHLHRTAAAARPGLFPVTADEPLHVAAAVSLEEVLGQLVTDYALRLPGGPVRVVLGASDALADQLLDGAPWDVLLSADPGQFDRLAAAGLVAPEGAAALAENALAALGPAGRPVAVRRPADLLGPAVRRVALAGPSSPLGGYTRTYLDGLGLYAAVLRRAVLVDHSRAVVAAVQAGQADAGIAYRSAAATATGCRILFHGRPPAPRIRYAGAVLARTRRPERSRDFLAFLGSKDAARRFRRGGFQPVRPRPASSSP